MALPDYGSLALGTPIVWGEAGATTNYTVTKTLSLNNLASTKARMGVYADLGANWNRLYLVMLIVETGTAPTAALTADLYLPCSFDSIVWPSGVTGSDAAFKDSEEVEWLRQLNGPVMQLKATNDGNVTQVQAAVLWTPKGRYVAPVVYNQLGVGFRNQATASNNTSRVVLYPVLDQIQDNAP